MVTITQMQNGIQAFIENEFLPVLPGWKKAAAATVVALWLRNFPGVAQEFLEGPVGKGMGIYKDGMIDLDTVYNEAVKQFAQPVPVNIPGLGTVTLTKENIDTLYGLIQEAKG